MIPGWPYSVIAEPGRTSWTAVLDAVRLGPDDDETEVTAAQVRAVITRLIEAGHWREGAPRVLVIFDAGYDVTRLAFLLADLPAELLGRLRSDRVMQLPAAPRPPGTLGRPCKHGRELALPDPWLAAASQGSGRRLPAAVLPGCPAHGTGAAPPASRLLRIADATTLRAGLTPETSAAPQAGTTGRPRLPPAARGTPENPAR